MSTTAPSGDRPVEETSAAAPRPTDASAANITGMAAERTWLAWWRTALAATAGALGVGRLAPDLLQVAAWPYVVLGCSYAMIEISLLVVGAGRQHKLQRTLVTGKPTPVSFALVAAFTLAGSLLALMTAVLVVAQL